jgi:hypothetical protein
MRTLMLSLALLLVATPALAAPETIIVDQQPGMTAVEVEQTVDDGKTWKVLSPQVLPAACVSIADVYRTRDGAFDVSGTFTGTAQFEGTIDGSTWRSLTVTPLAGGSAVTSATAAGAFTYAAALVGVRVRASALSSGSITAAIIAR